MPEPIDAISAAALAVATVLARILASNYVPPSGQHEEKKASATVEPKAPGLLRDTAGVKWAPTPPKPKTDMPSTPGQKAESQPTAKPPSSKAYMQDIVESLYNPARGSRITKA